MQILSSTKQYRVFVSHYFPGSSPNISVLARSSENYRDLSEKIDREKLSSIILNPKKNLQQLDFFYVTMIIRWQLSTWE